MVFGFSLADRPLRIRRGPDRCDQEFPNEPLFSEYPGGRQI